MILYSPGYGAHNKSELESVCSALRNAGHDVIAHEWSHWSNESKKGSAMDDLELIKSEIAENQIDIVIAKSIGTFVASNLIWTKTIDPSKIIFLGVPLNDLDMEDKELIKLVIQRIKEKLTLIHNTNDPHASLVDLHTFLGNTEPQIITKEANDHGYDYPEEILLIIRNTNKL